jgi:hypothetical protein
VQSWTLTILVAVVILTGGGLLLYTWLSGNATPSNQTASTTGTVLRCEATNDGAFNVVSFEVNGATQTALTRVAAHYPCIYADGQRVTVTYDPSDPSSASVSDGPPFNGIDFGKIWPFFLVVVLLGVGMSILRRRRSGAGSAQGNLDPVNE